MFCSLEAVMSLAESVITQSYNVYCITSLEFKKSKSTMNENI